MRRRTSYSAFERAIRDARTWEVEEDDVKLYAILIPREFANDFRGLPHARRVVGGIMLAWDEETLATMVADTLDALAAGGEQTETFRRRVALLRRVVGRERWAEAELAWETAQSVLQPGRMQ